MFWFAACLIKGDSEGIGYAREGGILNESKLKLNLQILLELRRLGKVVLKMTKVSLHL
jgi:hypothetical protein